MKPRQSEETPWLRTGFLQRKSHFESHMIRHKVHITIPPRSSERGILAFSLDKTPIQSICNGFVRRVVIYIGDNG